MFKTDFSCLITDAFHHLPLRDPLEGQKHGSSIRSSLAKQNTGKLLTKSAGGKIMEKCELSRLGECVNYRQVLITELILQWKSRNFLFKENRGKKCTGGTG